MLCARIASTVNSNYNFKYAHINDVLIAIFRRSIPVIHTFYCFLIELKTFAKMKMLNAMQREMLLLEINVTV